MELTARKQKILASIVKSYIALGEPVGSKLIAEEIGVSSATVRNEMAELIELGLLEQPHTSAGRIPSQSGYREYVNEFVHSDELPPNIKGYFDSVLSGGAFDREKLIVKGCESLADATRLAVIGSTPSGKTARITAVQFVQISRRTAMLILMSSAGTMKTTVFHCEFDLSPEIMRIFFRVFNEKVAGMAVSSITPAFIQSLGISFGELTMIMTSALIALLDAAQETMNADIILRGQMNLLLYPEFHQGSVRRIFDLLSSNNGAANILDYRQSKPTVRIGSEIGISELRNASVVTASYFINNQDAGAFAVVGPMRMNYSLAVSSAEYVSAAISKMLTKLMSEE